MSETNERHVRTGTEKAQDALEKADRKVEKLQVRHDRLKGEFERVVEELREAKAEREFAASHPLLQPVAEQGDLLGDDEG